MRTANAELHVFYEEARSASTNPRRRAEPVAIMKRRWKEAAEPHLAGE